MLIKVDPTSRTPLNEQIAAGIRGSIASGGVDAGERLPTARELAEALGVNVNTVLRAYAQLRDEGLLDVRRRRGVTVTGAGEGRARLHQLGASLVDEARRHGMSKEDIVKFVRSLT